MNSAVKLCYKSASSLLNFFKWNVKDMPVRSFSIFSQMQQEKIHRYKLGYSYCLYDGGRRNMHSKTNVSGKEELIQFLSEEIHAECEVQKSTIPSQIGGFEVHLSGSDISLTKNSDSETIEINFNINYSISSLGSEHSDSGFNTNDNSLMKSLPNFDISIKRNNKTLVLSCFYLERYEPQRQDNNEYIFAIDNIMIYESNSEEPYYEISRDSVNPVLCDLLMKYLAENGVTNDLIVKMSELSTCFEHTTYINLLNDLKKFAS